jgi:hypothetical protein
MTTIAAKVEHVLAAPQTRKHHCHWPGCAEQVPPAKWGCKRHWFMLPKPIRDRIWRAYRPGQEETGRPGHEYMLAASDAQRWIREQGPRQADLLEASR